MFHDAPILAFAASPGEVTIEIGSFAVSETEDHPGARIRITGFRRISMNGAEVPEASSPSQEGEILGLDEDAGGVDLSVQWDLPDRRSEFVRYRFEGESARVEVALSAGPR